MPPPTAPQSPPAVHLAILFAGWGCYAMISQAVLLRQFLVVFGGNELALGLFFGAWFLGIADGAEMVGRWTRRIPATQTVAGATLALGGFLPLALLIAMKTMPVWLRLPAGEVVGWLTVALAGLLCFPLGCWVGLSFPLFASLTDEDVHGIGRMFVWEAVGSAGAGLLFALVLALWVPPVGAALLAAAFLWLGAGFAFPNRFFKYLFPVGAVLAVVLAISPLADRGEQRLEQKRFAALSTGADFEASLQTPYQNVIFARTGGQAQLYGNGTYLDSYPDPYQFRQTAALLLGQTPRPRRIALLDGGLTGLAEALLKSDRVEELDIAYLDDILANGILDRIPAADRDWLSDSRLRVIHEDARAFLRRPGPPYDLMVVLSPDPSTALLNRLYTREFFREAAGRLGADGVLMLAVTGAENVLGDEVGPYVGSIDATLRAVFPLVVALPGDQVWFVAGAATAPLTDDPVAMKANYRGAFAGEPPMDPAVLDLYALPERIAGLRQALAAIPPVINQDLRPVSYLTFLRLWDRFAGGQLAGALALSARLPRWFWLAAILVAAGLSAWLPNAVKPAKRAGGYALLSVASSGFCAIIAVIIASLAYQSLFGQIYRMAALLFAVYMLGLALGGWVGNRIGEAPVRRLPGMLAGDFLLALCGLAFYGFLPWAVLHPIRLAQAGLLSLVFLSGATSGMAFPLAARVLEETHPAAGYRAGRVEATDHLAALAGSFLAGMILLPRLGLQTVAAIWLLCKLAVALGGWRVWRKTVADPGRRTG
ncbi:MAG: hypothetical protein GX444_06300 [Myxococcales bacterium]|nr:hypothetical protein [Myxococcales bacterium]